MTPRLILVRHGETEWSRTGRHTGRTDISLTEAGERQGKSLTPRLADLALRDPAVFVSPRVRAVRTAELAGIDASRGWDDLVEWDYGEYEGLTTPQIRETVPNWTVFTHRCPGGEAIDTVAARADMVLSVVRPMLADRDVILVGHGHFGRVLVARWIDSPAAEGRRFALHPASLTVLSYEHGTAQVTTLNS